MRCAFTHFLFPTGVELRHCSVQAEGYRKERESAARCDPHFPVLLVEMEVCYTRIACLIFGTPELRKTVAM